MAFYSRIGSSCSGDEDALVILRHDIVQECRALLQRQSTEVETQITQAHRNNCPQEALMYGAEANRLQRARAALESLIDMDTYRQPR